MGYKRHFFKSVGWVGTLRVLMRGITFIRLAVLARLLSPFQFGLVGIATLVLAILEIFTETGINVFLVQEEDRIEKYIDTAWIVSIIRGLIISLVIFLSASLVASFFNSRESYGLVLLISIVPLVRGFINPSIVSFQKDLKFHKEFFYQGSLFLVDAIVTLVFAFITKSAVSIIYGMLASVVFELIISFIFIKPTPKLNMNYAHFLKLIHSGKWITAAGIFNYLYQNLDNIVVGKILGVQALGLYNVGYKISSLPITEVSDVSSRVTFPLYVKIGGDKDRLKSAFVKVILFIAFLAISLGLVLFFFTKELVVFVLGQQWVEAVPVIKILVFYGVLRGISGSSSALFLALKKQEYVTVMTFISMIGLATTIIPLVLAFGLVGAGYSAIIGSLLPLPFIIYYLLKTFK